MKHVKQFASLNSTDGLRRERPKRLTVGHGGSTRSEAHKMVDR